MQIERVIPSFTGYLESAWDMLSARVNQLVKKILISSFFAGFKVLPSATVSARRRLLAEQFQISQLPCGVEAKYIQSASGHRTGNVIVICLNTTYEDHHPRHYRPFLENGADVVLWNPTGNTPKEYETDLMSVLRSIRTERPLAGITLKTYCANVDPAISAAAQLDVQVNMIIDRGHGDALSLARSVTAVARCKVVQNVLQRDFMCGGLEKIRNLRGRILFLIPKAGDQMMDYKRGNLTRDLVREAGDRGSCCLIPGDHWAKWGKTAYAHAFRFLNSLGVTSSEEINEGEYPDPAPPPFFNRYVLPILIKATGC